MIITTFAVVILVRVMIDMLFMVLHDVFIINHIQIPPPGWKLQVIKFVFTLMLATPIVGSIAVYPS